MSQGSGVAVSCGIGHRHGSDPVLLWLWHRLAVVALILPLAWELLYAVSAALKSKKKKKKLKKNHSIEIYPEVAHATELVDKNIKSYNFIPYVPEARENTEHVRDMQTIKSQSNVE